MQNSNATCQARARQHYDSTLDINSTASTEKLSTENRQLLDSSTGRHMESASTGSTKARQELDRLDRQGLDNGLDSASTEPRQLDSSTARAQGECGFQGVWIRLAGLTPPRRSRVRAAAAVAAANSGPIGTSTIHSGEVGHRTGKTGADARTSPALPSPTTCRLTACVHTSSLCWHGLCRPHLRP
jgi:hypothetical protein